MTRNSLMASCEKRARARPSVGVGEVHAVDEDRGLAGVAAGADDRPAVMKRKPPRSRCTPGARKASFWKSRFGDRQFLDLLGHDVRGGVGLVDVHQRRLADDVDRLGDLRHPQGDVQSAIVWPTRSVTTGLLRAALEARELHASRR
jgi:hypothetical protein